MHPQYAAQILALMHSIDRKLGGKPVPEIGSDWLTDPLRYKLKENG